MADGKEQWCEAHWARVEATWPGPGAVNGLLVMYHLVAFLVQHIYEEGPPEEDMEKLLERSYPLCCCVEPESFEVIMERSLMPEKYRSLPRPHAYMQHLQFAVRGFDATEN